MFNGIIFNKGTINSIKKRAKGINLFIKSSLKVSSKNLGISISCDGVCLTLISYKNNTLEFYLSNETLVKSKFRNAANGLSPLTINDWAVIPSWSPLNYCP